MKTISTLNKISDRKDATDMLHTENFTDHDNPLPQENGIKMRNGKNYNRFHKDTL